LITSKSFYAVSTHKYTINSLETYKRKGLRRYSEKYKLLAIELLKQGVKHRQIARLLGTNHTNIYDWEKKFLKEI